MYILINNLRKKLYIKVIATYTIERIIENIKELNNIDNFDLYYKGVKLDIDKTLLQYNIEENSILDVKFKINGGNLFIKIIGFIFSILFCFIIFPFIFCSGLIQFIGGVIEYIIYTVISSLLTVTGNIKNNIALNALSKTIVFLLKIFKIAFVYLFVYASFGLALISWNFIINTLFNPDNPLCHGSNNIKMATTVLTIFYLIFYIVYEIPDAIIAGTTAAFSGSTFFRLFIQPILIFLRFIVDHIKEFSLAVNPLAFIFEPIVLFLDTGLDVGATLLSAFLDLILNIGCAIPSEDEFQKVTSKQFDIVKHEQFGKFIGRIGASPPKKKNTNKPPPSINDLKEHLLKNSHKKNTDNVNAILRGIDDSQKSTNTNGTDGYEEKKYKNPNTGCEYQVVRGTTEQTASDYNPGKIISQQSLNAPNTSELECCSDEVLQGVSNIIETITTQQGLEQILQEYGISDEILKVAALAFDEHKTHLELVRSGGFTTALFLSMLMRIVVCNLLNLTKDAQTLFTALGTPQRLAESMKSGISAGFCILLIYYIILLILFFVGLFSSLF